MRRQDPSARPLWPVLTLALALAACADAQPDEDGGVNAGVNSQPNNGAPNNSTNNDADPNNSQPDDVGGDDADAPGEDTLPDEGGEDIAPDDVAEDVERDAPVEDVDRDVPEMTGESGVYEALGERASVTVSGQQGALRTFVLQTTQELRDNDPPDRRVQVSEQAGMPRVRSRDVVFDGLFAMAVDEARQNMVSSISDFAFNNGNGVPCECFETGKNWRYVWTRDTSYAVDLGLAQLAPTRSRASLEFKLSARKAGGDLQIVQDTGSGGSWPVSSDRAIWALGALEALRHLRGDERTAFRDRALEAMGNTIAQDRAMIFEPGEGLYRGEQSFLDWREQTYPAWTVDDTVHIAMSRTLSTNIAHLILLRAAAQLAEEAGMDAESSRWSGQASALREAIRERFWLDDAGMFSSMTGNDLDPATLHRFDLLGLALAILHGVATEEEGRQILSRYPHTPVGAPVVWPQQPRTPVYHNRGIWPFVSAYAVLAARHVQHDGAFDHNLDSLLRGAALNVSNMENFDFLSQRPWIDDGPYSGPVVNSRRQLWSVAGYLGAIVKGVFGVEVDDSGQRLSVAPFLTVTLRNTWLAGSDEVSLEALRVLGRLVDVVLELPPVDAGARGGHHPIAGVTLDDAPVGPEGIAASALRDGSVIRVRFGAAVPGHDVTVVADDGDFRRFWSPVEPRLTRVQRQGRDVELTFDGSGEQGVLFNIFRDGAQVASGVGAGTWIDPAPPTLDTRTYCYAVESYFPSSGNRSHHSPPMCWWGENSTRVQDVPAWRFEAQGGAWATTIGTPHYAGWGGGADTLQVRGLRAEHSGRHLVQLQYGNGAGPISTGITAAVKDVEVSDARTGDVLARGPIVMPQLGTWERFTGSSFLPVDVGADRLLRITIRDGVNMSYFEHFRPYTAGSGGGGAPYNNVNIGSVRLLAMDGPADPAASSIVFDGADDVGKIPMAGRMAPGATLQTWDLAGLHADADSLYIVLASEAFEAPYKPLSVYLQVGHGSLGAATPAEGREYSSLTPRLPFTPDYYISARRLSDDGGPDGPWNALWRRDASGWTRQERLQPGVDWFIAADQHTLAIRLRRASLDGADRVRLVAHVVNAAPGNEWKDLIPPGHTPWLEGGGAFVEINLTTGAVTWP